MPPRYTWNPDSFTYHTETGARLSRSQVRSWVSTYSESVQTSLRDHTSAFREGRINVAEWEIRMRRDIKSMHMASASIAYGGSAQMGASELGRTGSILREQYSYLAQMVRDVENGVVPMDGRIDARAEMYGQAAYATFEQSYRAMMKEAGVEQEINVLGGANNCDGCLEETAKGWVEVGTLSDVGERDCLTNCNCEIEYRGGPLEQPTGEE